MVYSQTTKDSKESEHLHLEQGYLRPKPEGQLEALIAHSTGIVELSLGKITETGIQLESTQISLSPTAKQVDSLKREIEIEDGILSYRLYMQAVGQPKSPHLTAQLSRV